MGGVLGFIAKAFVAKKAVDSIKPDVPKQEAPATPAVNAPTPEANAETGVDTTGMELKRKAKGKKGLMIQPTNTSGGGSTGGTGLNI